MLFRCLRAGAAAALLGACAAIPDDGALTARVKAAIATDVSPATASAIDVQTEGGVVRLSGFVYSEEQAARALEAAASVRGVLALHSDLRLKPVPPPRAP